MNSVRSTSQNYVSIVVLDCLARLNESVEDRRRHVVDLQLLILLSQGLPQLLRLLLQLFLHLLLQLRSQSIFFDLGVSAPTLAANLQECGA